MASWFGWSEPYDCRSARRDPAVVVTNTLMLELGWQQKEAERQHRERENAYRRLRTGVDYSWLANTPRSSAHSTMSTGEKLALEELCAKVPPSCCGLVILRFREVLVTNEPEVQEVSGLFRSVLMEALDRMKEEEAAQRLARQWNNRRSASSMSLTTFRSRVRINPFGSTTGLTSAADGASPVSDLQTVSEDVERAQPQRVWSVPDFRYKGLGSSRGEEFTSVT